MRTGQPGKAASRANRSMTAILAKSIGSFTVLAVLIAEFNSEVLFAMNRSGLRSPVAAINTPFADNIPSSNPIGYRLHRESKAAKKPNDTICPRSPPIRTKCSVFFDAFCDRDFQNVVDYQPSRQQDQNTHQNTRRSHK